MNLFDLMLLAMSLTSLSLTVSISEAGKPLRRLVSKAGTWAEKLIHCPYCLSHWLAAAGVISLSPSSLLHQFLEVFACVTLTSIFSRLVVGFFLTLSDLENEGGYDEKL